MPFWSEFIGIVAEYRPIVVALPYVPHARRALWNEHAIVPVIVCCLVRYSVLDSGSPAKHFFDDGAHVGKLWGVCECREACTADHSIELGLRLALYFREGHHRKRPPVQRGRSSVKTGSTAMHSNVKFVAYAEGESITYNIFPERNAISSSDRG